MPPKRKKKAEATSRGLTRGRGRAPESPRRRPARPRRQRSRRTAARRSATYRDPLGGHWQILAALPLDRVEPTPFQRDLSEAHVKRLTGVIDALDRFLDPIIAVRSADGRYWTPNGNHRLASLRALGARSIVALVLPEPEIAYKILALNTEKAHNLREKSLEVIRMARDLAPARHAVREGLRARVRGGRVPDARRLLRAERPLRRRRVPPDLEARRRVPRQAARRRRSRSAPSAASSCSRSTRPSSRP